MEGDSTRSILLTLVSLLLVAGMSEGASDTREVVPASEILTKIERGEPVEYDGVIVEGDLDISKRNLSTELVALLVSETSNLMPAKEFKIVESPIDITNSEIQGNVIFTDALFQEHVNFQNTNFTRAIAFTRSNFSESLQLVDYGIDYGVSQNIHLNSRLCIFGANFVGAVFSGGDAQFSGSKFMNANFQRAKFSGGDADFSCAVFSGSDTDFLPAVFSGMDADFSYAVFSGGDADFSGAKFSGGNADFSYAVFSGGDADFSGVEFSGGDAIFGGGGVYIYTSPYFSLENLYGGAEFSGGNANFQRAKFSGGIAHFMGAKFTGGDANFRHVNFSGGSANFFMAQFSSNRNYKMDFRNTSFYDDACFVDTLFTQYADFREARFNGNLDLTHSQFDRLDIEWDPIKKHLVCDESVYMALVKNFNDLARFDDADDCYYEYRLESQQAMHFGVPKIFDWIARLSYGYGVRPLHTIGCSLFMILLFGLFFKLGSGIQKSTYPCKQILQKISWSDTFYFSALAFVSQPPYNWGPRDGSWWKYAVLVENILGWIFLTLFVIAMT